MTLFGYFHNPFIHESAEALVSLHHTKAGAWRAMRAGIFAAAVREREDHLRYGKGYFDTNLRFEAFRVGPVEVQP
jgi:hypothetical protein